MPFPGVFFDTTLLMRRRCAAVAPPLQDAPTLEVVAIDDDDAILADCLAVGRHANAARCRQRRQRGLRFYSFHCSGQPVANTWATRGGERFLDEAMLAFELGDRDACLRDVYVAAQQRGRGLFGRFVLALERGPLSGAERIWSCVEQSNASSRAAHLRCGFESCGKVSTLALFDRLMFRSGSIPADLPCREFEAARHLLWIDARARAFRHAHLA